MEFVCRENEHGGFEVFNTKFGDIYFSNVGAHKEALEKFVIPSLPVLNNKSKIKILDVCYGMGYNSKTLVDYILKNNIQVNCDIDAIDIDKNILALGLLIFDENIDKNVHLHFGNSILSVLDLDENLKNILGENWIKPILQKFCSNFDLNLSSKGVYLYQNKISSAFLHNIYYQNHGDLNKIINFSIKNGDLLKILPNLNEKYDLIYHDAFSILKQPELWTEDILKWYYELLNKNGRLLTYSNSRVLRRNLSQIGFHVEINYDDAEKQNGTIAIKS